MNVLPWPGSLSALDRAAVRLHHRTGDRQADAGAAVLARPGGCRPGRTARTAGAGARRGSRRPVSATLTSTAPFVPVRRRPRPAPPGGREPHRVVDQVEQHLVHALAVGIDRAAGRPGRRAARRRRGPARATSISEMTCATSGRERHALAVAAAPRRTRAATDRAAARRAGPAARTARASPAASRGRAAPRRRAGSPGARGSP